MVGRARACAIAIAIAMLVGVVVVGSPPAAADHEPPTVVELTPSNGIDDVACTATACWGLRRNGTDDRFLVPVVDGVPAATGALLQSLGFLGMPQIECGETTCVVFTEGAGSYVYFVDAAGTPSPGVATTPPGTNRYFIGTDADCAGDVCGLIGHYWPGGFGEPHHAAVIRLTATGAEDPVLLGRSDQPSSQIWAIDCVAPDRCLVGGIYPEDLLTGRPFQAFVQRWDSGVVGPVEPVPGGELVMALQCTTLDACVGVGSRYYPEGVEHAESPAGSFTVTGGAVSPMVTFPGQEPPPGSTDATIPFDLACSPDLDSCLVVGMRNQTGPARTSGAVMTLEGGAVTGQQTLPDVDTSLQNVACAPSGCLAVGGASSGGSSRTYLVTGLHLPGPADERAPSVSITEPMDGARLAVGETVAADFACVDEAGGSGIASCVAVVEPGGTVVAVGGPLPSADPGSFTLTVTGTDAAGNSEVASVGFEVVAGSVAEEVDGGGTVSTGAEATPDAPVQTTLTAPPSVSGAVTIVPEPAGADPAGFVLFDQAVAIDAPPATATDPYEATFVVDGSALAGRAPAEVQVFRDGDLVGGCTHPTDAVPDPCVAARGFTADGSGDAFVTVRTSQFSTWSLGVLVQAATRLDADPVLVKLGSGLLGLKVTVGTVSARLTTALGAPVAGEPVRFLAGGSAVCTGTTDANGEATCSGFLGGILKTLLAGGEVAVYDGDATHLPSIDAAPLIG